MIMVAKAAAPVDELQAFRQKVVEVALAEAKKHSWCDEVYKVLGSKLGLADLLPARYVIRRKDDIKSNWYDEDEPDTSETRVRQEFKRLITSRDRYLHTRPPSSAVTITPGSNLDELIDTLRKEHEKVNAKQIIWPQYALHVIEGGKRKLLEKA